MSFPLPLPQNAENKSSDRSASLFLTLDLADTVEKEGGIVKLAEELLSGKMYKTRVLYLLKIFYQQAGQNVTDDFLLQNAPADLLSDILAALLKAMETTGTDIASLKKFFFGVMGWPPVDARTATLEDLGYALQGFAEYRGLLPPPLPDMRFLAEMVKKYPDMKEQNG